MERRFLTGDIVVVAASGCSCSSDDGCFTSSTVSLLNTTDGANALVGAGMPAECASTAGVLIPEDNG